MCLFQVFSDVGAVHQQFFRHATDVDTSAAQVAAFGYGDVGAEASGEASGTHTAGTGANHKQVKIVGHFILRIGN